MLLLYLLRREDGLFGPESVVDLPASFNSTALPARHGQVNVQGGFCSLLMKDVGLCVEQVEGHKYTSFSLVGADSRNATTRICP